MDRPRILIVDDDLPFVGTLSATLKPSYEVSASPSRATALKAITDHPPDLILLNHLLPDASGLDVLRTIKESFPATIVIVMTALSSEDSCLESFRSGARDYLRKPIDMPDLHARIERLLAARGGPNTPRSPVLLDPPPPGPEAPPGSRGASLRRAVDFIDHNFREPLTLEQVAREAGMSKYHFCRMFKKFTGLTFGEFLHRCRVAHASDLLRDPRRSVTDIYLEVGFKDMSHFSRVFRRVTGQLPSSYRRSSPESPRVNLPPAPSRQPQSLPVSRKSLPPGLSRSASLPPPKKQPQSNKSQFQTSPAPPRPDKGAP